MFIEILFYTVGPKRYVNYFIYISFLFCFLFLWLSCYFLIALILNYNCYLLDSAIILANCLTILQISLSRHEQVCLIRVRFKRYFSHQEQEWIHINHVIRGRLKNSIKQLKSNIFESITPEELHLVANCAL